MDGIATVDGRIVPLADAKVSLMDRGYLLGDGVFETLRVSGRRPFRRDDHLTRLQRGLEVLGQDDSLVSDVDVAIDALVDGAAEAGLGDALYLRVNVTVGPSEDIAGNGEGVGITGTCKPFQPYPMSHYSDGVHLVVAKQRKDPRDPLSSIKHMSFLPYVAARRYAMSKTAHDAILLNTDGRVAEATTSNVFAVVDDVLHAPGSEEGALPGVTRQVVLELAEDTGLDVRSRLEVEELRRAEEAFVTNTIGGVVPVTRFEEVPVGDGTKGDLTTRLGHALEDMVRGAA